MEAPINNKAAAAAIRKELRAAFPATAFSVRQTTENTVGIRWRGAPDRGAVWAIAGRYEYGFRADGAPAAGFSASAGCRGLGVCRLDEFEAMT